MLVSTIVRRGGRKTLVDTPPGRTKGMRPVETVCVQSKPKGRPPADGRDRALAELSLAELSLEKARSASPGSVVPRRFIPRTPPSNSRPGNPTKYGRGTYETTRPEETETMTGRDV